MKLTFISATFGLCALVNDALAEGDDCTDSQILDVTDCVTALDSCEPMTCECFHAYEDCVPDCYPGEDIEAPIHESMALMGCEDDHDDHDDQDGHDDHDDHDDEDDELPPCAFDCYDDILEDANDCAAIADLIKTGGCLDDCTVDLMETVKVSMSCTDNELDLSGLKDNKDVCKDHDEVVQKESGGALADCAAGSSSCEDDSTLQAMGAPAGWYKPRCAATCGLCLDNGEFIDADHDGHDHGGGDDDSSAWKAMPSAAALMFAGALAIIF